MQFKPVLFKSQLLPTKFTSVQAASKDYFTPCHLIILPFHNFIFTKVLSHYLRDQMKFTFPK